MPWTDSDNDAQRFEQALAQGDVTKAHDIALRAAQFYENREDSKQKGFWLRALSWALYR